MTDRIPLDHLTSDQLDQLHDERDRLQIANHALNTAAIEAMERAERADAALVRVRALAGRWVTAGPPPLGTSVSRWWDARLIELNAALDEPTPDPAAANQADTDPDDPPVQCWHTEPGTPCDWNDCRQPERLTAGDHGTDPREQP